MERHKCKICFKRFVNGRALGGHMRSHLVNHPFPPHKPPSQPTESSTELSCSSSPSEDEINGKSQKESPNYTLRENPRKNSRFGDVSETENGPESDSDDSPELSSSTSDVTSEEDVALCLMMLSRDNWVAGPGAGGRGGFRCRTCDKVFRSYQALGGHRASHKKLLPRHAEVRPNPAKQSKAHECPVCDRVFGSAQALGGHKRVHSVSVHHHGPGVDPSGKIGNLKKLKFCHGRGNYEKSNGVYDYDDDDDGSPKKMIDLNLPAPVDQDDEISQISFSTV